MNKKICRIIIGISLASWSFGATDIAELKEQFKTPPFSLKSQPLWHLNGELTQEGIEQQLKASKEQSGFSGVALLPVSETKPAYLSEGYFEQYGNILEACKKLDMKVILYDDINYPSGSAGKVMREKYPEHLGGRLDMVSSAIAGPMNWQATLPEGLFMGAVAMNEKTGQRIDISEKKNGNRLEWAAPEGNWTIMLFTFVRAKNSVDYLNPESIDLFLSVTLDEYAKRFSSHFGKTITMTFFDDVNVRGNDRRNWTPNFAEKFQKEYGFSPVSYYPALWKDIGPETEAARVALFGFRARLLSEGYPKKMNVWAKKHGLGATGHAMGQYHPQPAFLGGDHIRFYEHCDIPMIDSIHYYGHGRPGFKLTSSASASYDRPLTAVEIYGNYATFDAAMLYRSGLELFARGANFFLPHGMWYVPEKMRIKPLISHFNPEVGPKLATYNEWVARCSLLLQGGRHVADIGVLYPVAAMHAYARMDAVVDQPKVAGNVHPGLYLPPTTDLNEISDCLTGELRQDFTFLHPDILDNRTTIKGNVLRLDNAVNFEEYRVVIVPSMRVIHASNAKKLQAFCEAGGRVIVTGQIPCKSAEFGKDAEVVEAFKQILDQRKKRQAYFIQAFNSETLGVAIQDALPVSDVRFAKKGEGVAEANPVQNALQKTESKGKQVEGMVSYLHKVKDGCQIYFVANSTDKPFSTELTVRGHYEMQLWNPHDGTMSLVQSERVTEKGEACTRVKLDLPSLESRFLIGL